MNRVKLELVTFKNQNFFPWSQKEWKLTPSRCWGEAAKVLGRVRRPQAVRMAGWTVGLIESLYQSSWPHMHLGNSFSKETEMGSIWAAEGGGEVQG